MWSTKALFRKTILVQAPWYRTLRSLILVIIIARAAVEALRRKLGRRLVQLDQVHRPHLPLLYRALLKPR